MTAIHPLNNGKLQSNVNAASYTITNVVTPSSDQDVATKGYVDSKGFVARGDATGLDFDVGDFSNDGDYHDFDFSGIVDTGAKAVVVFLSIEDDASTEYFSVRQKGNTGHYPRYICYLEANLRSSLTWTIPLDVDGKAEYRIRSGATLGTLDVMVIGWFM